MAHAILGPIKKKNNMYVNAMVREAVMVMLLLIGKRYKSICFQSSSCETSEVIITITIMIYSNNYIHDFKITNSSFVMCCKMGIQLTTSMMYDQVFCHRTDSPPERPESSSRRLHAREHVPPSLHPTEPSPSHVW